MYTPNWQGQYLHAIILLDDEKRWTSDRIFETILLAFSSEDIAL